MMIKISTNLEEQIKFIKQFEEDYNATIFHLVENYRSTQNIISASNELIAHNKDRMKIDHEIRINNSRRESPLGGDWSKFDELGEGLVQVVNYNDIFEQPEHVLSEIKRLMDLAPNAKWQDFALLGEREHNFNRFVQYSNIIKSLNGFAVQNRAYLL